MRVLALLPLLLLLLLLLLLMLLMLLLVVLCSKQPDLLPFQLLQLPVPLAHVAEAGSECLVVRPVCDGQPQACNVVAGKELQAMKISGNEEQALVAGKVLQAMKILSNGEQALGAGKGLAARGYKNWDAS